MSKSQDLIVKIVDRVMASDTSGRDKLDWMMDIDAVQSKVGLDLQKLADADDFNFNHDVFGIMRHLNRDTCELEDHFVPRCIAAK